MKFIEIKRWSDKYKQYLDDFEKDYTWLGYWDSIEDFEIYMKSMWFIII